VMGPVSSQYGDAPTNVWKNLARTIIPEGSYVVGGIIGEDVFIIAAWC